MTECPRCKFVRVPEDSLCSNCGLRYAEVSEALTRDDKSSSVFAAAIGALVGGLIGFLLRPSVPFGGKLPLDTILLRGTNLRGIDQLLVHTAEQSFDYMLVGAVIGLLVGLAARYLKPNYARLSATSPSVTSVSNPLAKPAKTPTDPGSQPKTISLDQTLDDVRAVLGAPDKVVKLSGKEIHIYRDMKITFTDGKVSDVLF